MKFMRQCPKCNRKYDDTWMICFNDSELLKETNEPAQKLDVSELSWSQVFRDLLKAQTEMQEVRAVWGGLFFLGGGLVGVVSLALVMWSGLKLLSHEFINPAIEVPDYGFLDVIGLVVGGFFTYLGYKMCGSQDK